MSLPINIAEQQRNPHNALFQTLQSGEKAALLTLINIEGNAPYPVGTQMLVTESGNSVGQITGGCAESAMVDQAVATMQAGQDMEFRYGLNSPFIDIKLPCGSGIDVHFEVDFNIKEIEQQRSALLKRHGVERKLTTQLGDFRQYYLPQERIIVLGQGPILTSVVKLANQSGFDVVAITQHPQQSKELLQHGIVAVSLSEAGNQFIELCDEHTALVSLFHEHEREQHIFLEALKTQVFYLGALGSKNTHRQRVDNLQALGVNKTALSRIHAPIGLDINATTPQQIAVSIIAEIIKEIRPSKPSGLS